jgi:hypothetical protein
MSIPAWQVITWQSVNTDVDEWRNTVTKLRHLGTSVHVDPGGALMYGQVLWGTESDDDQRVGMAWDWCEVRKNVVALVDPMTIITNLSLNDGGVCLSDAQRLLYLNDAIHDLPWQDAIRDLRRSGGAVPLAA